MDNEAINKIVQSLSLEEKAYMLTGKSQWEIKGVERLGINSIIVADGPHGLRKAIDIGSDKLVQKVEKAICFPTASSLAASFNPHLVHRMGQLLGEECQAMDVQVLLGPGTNIKRSPLCGRNFEYFSEDPFLAGELAKAMIRGIQSKGVGACLKHFVANNQETWRNTVNAVVDERTLREIYLAAFEKPVKEAVPWAVMASYNRVNGYYMCENEYLLKDVLRTEWQFPNVILSDWVAVDHLNNAVGKGLDLEMPTSGDVGPQKVIRAVQQGKLDLETVNNSVQRLVSLLLRADSLKQKQKEKPFDTNANANAIKLMLERDHEAARLIAGECLVLLKNENDILPLTKGKSVAVIGKFAETPRYQGGGSSHINSYKVDTVLEELRNRCCFCGDKNSNNNNNNNNVNDNKNNNNYDIPIEFDYAEGYSLSIDDIVPEKLQKAVELAKTMDIAVLLIGLPDAYETEGLDRTHIRIPPAHKKLIESVLEVNSNVILLLSGGSVLEIPFIEQVKGALYCGLPGEAGAAAVVDVLLGKVNPSGRLAETFIRDESQDPGFGNMPGNPLDGEVKYEEGVFVGYRFHDKRKTDVLFEFGYGLSYTKFEYSNLKVEHKSFVFPDNNENSDGNDYDCTESKGNNENNNGKERNLKVTVDVKNIGKMSGKEVVQLYITEQNPLLERPEKELKGFVKVELEPQQTKTVEFSLCQRSFAYYNVDIRNWHVNPGNFKIQIRKSSKEIVLEKTVCIETTNNNEKENESQKEKDKKEFQIISEVTQEKVYRGNREFIKPMQFNRNTQLLDLKDHVIGQYIYRTVLKEVKKELKEAASMMMEQDDNKSNHNDVYVNETDEYNNEDSLMNPEITLQMVNDMPLRSIVNATAGKYMSDWKLNSLIYALNITKQDTVLGKFFGLFRR